MPQISVIVPVYKVEPYIRQCVDSILAQTFTDFELILVDDGSPDNCGAICDEYAEKDKRVRVIHQENGGLSSARNAGLALAKGEYIYFCDSDDFISETLFEDAISYLPKYDMVVFNYQRVDETGRPLEPASSFQYTTTGFKNVEEKHRFLQGPFFSHCFIGWEACFRFFRKDIIDQYRLTFADNRVIFAEDMYFSFCYLLHMHSFFCMEGVYYNYIKHEDSIMGVEMTRYNVGRMNELGKALLKHITESYDPESEGLCFPVVYLRVMNHVISRIRYYHPEYRIQCIRNIIMKDLGNPAFFIEQIHQLTQHRNELTEAYGRINSLRLLAEYRYYADGRILLFALRMLLIKLTSYGKKAIKAVVGEERVKSIKKALHK